MRKVAEAHGAFQPVLVDLDDFKLPLLDEAEHPRNGVYAKAHTRAWSQSVAAADAFVFVAPEYNHAPPPTLINAVNFLFHEWAYKPAGFVSYGGVAGGVRAAQAEKAHLTALRMMPIPQSVNVERAPVTVPRGDLETVAVYREAAMLQLNELRRWAQALKALRASN
jgi:NAD(P)H-dependent FMN reductase